MGILNFIVLAIFGLAIGTTLFYGLINLTKKSFQPSNEPVVDSRDMLRDQKRRLDDMEQKQKDLRRMQEQQIKDLQRMQKR